VPAFAFQAVTESARAVVAATNGRHTVRHSGRVADFSVPQQAA
jgi:hypothetical protein